MWPCKNSHFVTFVKGLCRRQPHKRFPLQQGRIQNLENHGWFTDSSNLPAFSWKSLDARDLPAPWRPRMTASPKANNTFLEDSLGSGVGSGWSRDFEEVCGPEPSTFLKLQ